MFVMNYWYDKRQVFSLDKISERSLIHNTIRLKSIMISTTEAGTCQPLLVHYIHYIPFYHRSLIINLYRFIT